MSSADDSDKQSFSHLLVSKPPREVSGARSGNRFNFQYSWALCLLLKLHANPDDYCVLFDFHDDVVVLDDSTNPTLADFYQVKTETSKNWTPTSLTSQKKGKTGPLPSNLGKLYEHYLTFPQNVRTLTFIGCARFKMSLATEPPSINRERFSFADLHDDEKAEIEGKLKAELNQTSALAGLSLTHFENTPLSAADHETHAQGAVCKFLDQQPDRSIPAVPFYQSIRSEVQRRSTKESHASTFLELRTSRGLTRNDVQVMIDSVTSHTQREDLLESIRTQLSTEQFDPRRSHEITRGVRSYLAQRHDQTNFVLTNAAKRVAKELAKYTPPEDQSCPLTSVIATLKAVVAKEFTLLTERYTEPFLHAIFLVTFYEQTLPKADSQSAEEGP